MENNQPYLAIFGKTLYVLSEDSLLISLTVCFLNFARQDATHGNKHTERAPGSIGQASWPSRVFKGMRMAGRMGSDNVTVKNLEIVDIDNKNNLLFIKGAIPGANNSPVFLFKK